MVELPRENLEIKKIPGIPLMMKKLIINVKETSQRLLLAAKILLQAKLSSFSPELIEEEEWLF